jgi:hypothetical protein
MTKYWFRQKTIGYGSTPNTWQGWLLTSIFLLLVAGIAFTGPHIRDNHLRALLMLAGLPLLTLIFIWIAHAKTEGGWRWKNRSE